MKKNLLILGTLFVLSAITGWAIADNIKIVPYVDDVYFWPEQSTSGNVPQEPEKVTFIEDSITQQSDTIVKAHIRR